MSGRSSCVILVSLWLGGISPAGATTLSFDEPITFYGSSTTSNFEAIATQGFDVEAIGGDYHFLADGADFCSGGCPDNGSTYLLGWGATFTLAATDKSPFSLIGFDAAESSLGSVSHWAEALLVTGSHDGETVARAEFRLDWTATSDPAPANDFETFDLDFQQALDFGNLTSLSFAAIGGKTGDFSLDNIVLGPALPAFDSGLSDVDLVVVATPLPAAGWLFASALLGFAGLGRRYRVDAAG